MLTERQREVLTIIKANHEIKLKDIISKLDLKAVSTVHVHIQKLIQQGFLIKENGKFIITDRDENEFTPIPYYGLAQCGDTDVFSEERILDYIKIPTKNLPYPNNNLFFIKAKGDSMEPNISDGQLLLFRKISNTPANNAIVFCKKGDGLKIKRFNQYIDEEGNKKFRLVSDNKLNYEPLSCEDVEILGQLTHLK